jgi:hypothetical protein
MDVDRYCFFECKPAKGWEAPVTSACVSLAAEDRKTLGYDRTGNAVDPAMLKRSGLKPRVVPAKMAEKIAVASPVFLQKQMGHPVVEATHATADSARDQASQTQGVASDLREAQVKKAEEIKNAAAAPDPLDNIKSVLADSERAKKAAQAAQVEAGKAEEAVVLARKESLEQGIQSGKNAMEEVKAAQIQGVKDLAAFRDKLVNKVELKAIAAAAKASEPYMLSMLRAQKTVADYTAQANADQAKAKSLQAEAMGLAGQANAAKDPNSAAILYSQAQDKAAEAKQVAENAKSLFDTADQMNKDMPKYQGAAQAAAARAAFDSMPAWQPAALAPFPDYAKR